MTFLKTERDKSLRALQLMELEILKEFDRICRKHDIKYSLGGGTCLGQLRHGGFIPWDDDIDVDMTIEEYEKFLNVVEKELDHNRFFFRSRKTDKKHLRTNPRIELINTHMLQKRWTKNNKDIGVFIDIFTWSYLPSNKFLRKLVSTQLFHIRCIQCVKEFHAMPKKASKASRPFISICARIVPNFILNSIENRLRHCVKKEKAKWILDDAIINGNHGGYPIDGIEEYEDVKFEGITVMNKKNPYTFMETIYGPNYMQWLDPVKRISHHKWTIVDFGPYVEKYDLPSNYKDYVSIIFTPEKLKHMQKISLDMANYVSNICKKNKLKYFVSDKNCLFKEKGIEDYGSLWQHPLTLALPRNDYEKLCNILEKDNNNMYFLQNNKTEKKYHYNYSKFMLNCTSLRDAAIPIEYDAHIDNGFYINLVPLDYAPNDKKKQKMFNLKVKWYNNLISVKWRKCNLRGIKNGSIKMKILIFILVFTNLKRLEKKYNKLINKYKNTNYYVDSSGNIGNKIFNKSIFGDGKEEKYNGQKLVFPSKIQDFNKLLFEESYIKDMEYKSYLKKNSPKYYENEFINHLSQEFIDKIESRFKACYLNYFDMEEYQLSVLRYDNINDKYLTNEEVLKAYNAWKKKNS